jgi:hypothetical protein
MTSAVHFLKKCPRCEDTFFLKVSDHLSKDLHPNKTLKDAVLHYEADKVFNLLLLHFLQILRLIVHRLDGSNCHFFWRSRLLQKSLMPFKQTSILVVKLPKVRLSQNWSLLAANQYLLADNWHLLSSNWYSLAPNEADEEELPSYQSC